MIYCTPENEPQCHTSCSLRSLTPFLGFDFRHCPFNRLFPALPIVEFRLVAESRFDLIDAQCSLHSQETYNPGRELGLLAAEGEDPVEPGAQKGESLHEPDGNIPDLIVWDGGAEELGDEAGEVPEGDVLVVCDEEGFAFDFLVCGEWCRCRSFKERFYDECLGVSAVLHVACIVEVRFVTEADVGAASESLLGDVCGHLAITGAVQCGRPDDCCQHAILAVCSEHELLSECFGVRIVFWLVGREEYGQGFSCFNHGLALVVYN